MSMAVFCVSCVYADTDQKVDDIKKQDDKGMSAEDTKKALIKFALQSMVADYELSAKVGIDIFSLDPVDYLKQCELLLLVSKAVPRDGIPEPIQNEMDQRDKLAADYVKTAQRIPKIKRCLLWRIK